MRAFRSALLLDFSPSFFFSPLEVLFPSSGVFAALLIILATSLNLILLVPLSLCALMSGRRMSISLSAAKLISCDSSAQPPLS